MDSSWLGITNTLTRLILAGVDRKRRPEPWGASYNARATHQNAARSCSITHACIWLPPGPHKATVRTEENGNKWCLRPRFCTCKAILGWEQPGLMRGILLWIKFLVQDRSLDLLTNSPVRNHSTTDHLSLMKWILLWIVPGAGSITRPVDQQSSRYYAKLFCLLHWDKLLSA